MSSAIGTLLSTLNNPKTIRVRSRLSTAPKTVTDLMADEISAAESEGRSAIVNEHAFHNMTPEARQYIRDLAEFRGVSLMLGK